MASSNGKQSSIGDKFTQFAYLSVTMSGANTLTFARLDVITGALMGSKQYGLLIERAEIWYADATLRDLDTDGDTMESALTVSNGISDISPSNPEVIVHQAVLRTDAGTAANATFHIEPIARDFTGLTGGGLLVPADRLYLAMASSGMTVAGVTRMRLYYKTVELGAQEYLELLQARSILST